MSRRRPWTDLRPVLPSLLAVLPLILLWPALRHSVEARMLFHMLLEFPLLLASGWAVYRLGLRRGRAQRLARGLALVDWRGWTGATLVSVLTIIWMVPAALDLALLSTPVAAAKYAGWWLTGWVLAGSLRRMDPELLLFLAGNLAWMMASAGLLYIDAPARLCVNYLQDDQRQTGIALVITAVGLGVLALQQMLRAGAAPAAETQRSIG